MITLCISNMVLELDYSVFVEQMYNFFEWNTDYSTIHIPCVKESKVNMSKHHIDVVREAIMSDKLCGCSCASEPTPIAVFLDDKGTIHYVDITIHSDLLKQQGNDILDLFMLCPKVASDIQLEYERKYCW